MLTAPSPGGSRTRLQAGRGGKGPRGQRAESGGRTSSPRKTQSAPRTSLGAPPRCSHAERGLVFQPPCPPSILHWARTPHTHHYPTHNAAGVSSSATSDSESQAQRPGSPLPLSLLPGVAPGGRGSLACPPAPSQPEGGHACGKGLSKQATRARTIQRVRPSPQCDGRSGPYPEHSGRGQHWVWRNWPAFALGRPGSSHPGPPTLGQRLLWGPQPGPWP